MHGTWSRVMMYRSCRWKLVLHFVYCTFLVNCWENLESCQKNILQLLWFSLLPAWLLDNVVIMKREITVTHDFQVYILSNCHKKNCQTYRSSRSHNFYCCYNDNQSPWSKIKFFPLHFPSISSSSSSSSSSNTLHFSSSSLLSPLSQGKRMPL